MIKLLSRSTFEQVAARCLLSFSSCSNAMNQNNADLTTCWNWNTKLYFVYATAEYVTSANVLIPSHKSTRRPSDKLLLQVFNQVVIWDGMLKSKDTAVLDLIGERNKYFLTDQGLGLRFFLMHEHLYVTLMHFFYRGADINVTFTYHTSPNVGILFPSVHGSHRFTFPSSYI